MVAVTSEADHRREDGRASAMARRSPGVTALLRSPPRRRQNAGWPSTAKPRLVHADPDPPHGSRVTLPALARVHESAQRAGPPAWPNASWAHLGLRVAGEGQRGAVCGPAMLMSQLTPNLSEHIPKKSPQGARSSGIETMPPAVSPSQNPRSSASSSPLSETE